MGIELNYPAAPAQKAATPPAQKTAAEIKPRRTDFGMPHKKAYTVKATEIPHKEEPQKRAAAHNDALAAAAAISITLTAVAIIFLYRAYMSQHSVVDGDGGEFANE